MSVSNYIVWFLFLLSGTIVRSWDPLPPGCSEVFSGGNPQLICLQDVVISGAGYTKTDYYDSITFTAGLTVTGGAWLSLQAQTVEFNAGNFPGDAHVIVEKGTGSPSLLEFNCSFITSAYGDGIEVIESSSLHIDGAIVERLYILLQAGPYDMPVSSIVSLTHTEMTASSLLAVGLRANVIVAYSAIHDLILDYSDAPSYTNLTLPSSTDMTSFGASFESQDGRQNWELVLSHSRIGLVKPQIGYVQMSGAPPFVLTTLDVYGAVGGTRMALHVHIVAGSSDKGDLLDFTCTDWPSSLNVGEVCKWSPLPGDRTFGVSHKVVFNGDEPGILHSIGILVSSGTQVLVEDALTLSTIFVEFGSNLHLDGKTSATSAVANNYRIRFRGHYIRVNDSSSLTGGGLNIHNSAFDEVYLIASDSSSIVLTGVTSSVNLRLVTMSASATIELKSLYLRNGATVTTSGFGQMSINEELSDFWHGLHNERLDSVFPTVERDQTTAADPTQLYVPTTGVVPYWRTTRVLRAESVMLSDAPVPLILDNAFGDVTRGVRLDFIPALYNANASAPEKAYGHISKGLWNIPFGSRVKLKTSAYVDTYGVEDRLCFMQTYMSNRYNETYRYMNLRATLSTCEWTSHETPWLVANGSVMIEIGCTAFTVYDHIRLYLAAVEVVVEPAPAGIADYDNLRMLNFTLADAPPLGVAPSLNGEHSLAYWFTRGYKNITHSYDAMMFPPADMVTLSCGNRLCRMKKLFYLAPNQDFSAEVMVKAATLSQPIIDWVAFRVDNRDGTAVAVSMIADSAVWFTYFLDFQGDDEGGMHAIEFTMPPQSVVLMKKLSIEFIDAPSVLSGSICGTTTTALPATSTTSTAASGSGSSTLTDVVTEESTSMSTEADGSPTSVSLSTSSTGVPASTITDAMMSERDDEPNYLLIGGVVAACALAALFGIILIVFLVSRSKKGRGRRSSAVHAQQGGTNLSPRSPRSSSPSTGVRKSRGGSRRHSMKVRATNPHTSNYDVLPNTRALATPSGSRGSAPTAAYTSLPMANVAGGTNEYDLAPDVAVTGGAEEGYGAIPSVDNSYASTLSSDAVTNTSGNEYELGRL